MTPKKLLIIGVLTLTILLSGVAVYTALKLYKIGTKPSEEEATKKTTRVYEEKETAPAPEIYQQEEETGGVCELTFTVQPEDLACWSECTTNDQCIAVNSAYQCLTVNEVSRCANPDCPTEEDCLCPEASPSPSPSPSPAPPGCWETCVQSPDNCPSSMTCQNVNGTLRCVNPTCPTEENCICPSPSPSPTPTPSPSPSPYYPSPSPSPYTPSPSPVALVTPAAPTPPPAPAVPAAPPAPQLPEAGFLSPTIIFSIGGIALVLLGLLL